MFSENRQSHALSNKCRSCGATIDYGIPSRVRKFCSIKCAGSAASKRQSRHGESHTRLHRIWTNVKCRCQNTDDEYYGGRGISMCSEWADSYEAFRDWSLTNGYAETLEIDRRNVNGNYEPSNCRWANRQQQTTNRRKKKNSISRFKGVGFDKRSGKWRAQLTLRGISVFYREFKGEIEAAKAYDEAAKKYFGEFAHLNFKD